ncbi:hypothetical protein TRAPUB_5774 [Trametes pubescens]|uniref:Fungal-type protein kinase domain-containing protein n=1 Tax=Trametes pubescens TaxID=154538 RepID=A0A1M2V7L8_TRAPU|nr:hypothetical protein TRAPUB_5774 [Trametes pubescens]
MAYEILKFTGIIHNTHHDLESFYWVLLWVVVRHTEHGHVRGDKLCGDIFKFGEDRESASAKRDWLEDEKLDIPKNKPLTYLLNELGGIVLEHLPTLRKGVSQIFLDYDRVLKIFDEAIEMPGWPTRDWQPCNLSTGDGRTGIADVAPKPPKPPGLVSALDEDTLFPTHPDLPAPHSLDPHLLPNVSPKKRYYDTVDEEDELDSRGTAWMSQSLTSNRSKRIRTNEGTGHRPVTKSQSHIAHAKLLVAPRQSARVRAAQVRKLRSEGA